MTEKKNDFIEFDVSKPNLKSAVKAHKRFAASNKKISANPLECILFRKRGTELFLETSDGSRALITSLHLFTENGVDGEFCINMNLLSKMFFLPKGLLETITITQTDKAVEFLDNDTNTIQVFQQTNCEFPNIREFIPSINNRAKIGVSKDLIKDLASLKTNRGSVLEIYIGKPLEAIIAKTTGEDINQTALVMPLKLTKEEDKK